MPTGPAYISPTDAGAPQPQSAQALQMTPKKKRGKVWLFILLAIVLFGAIASVAIVTAIKTSRSLARKVIIKPTTEVPQPQQPPAVPGLPSPPASGTTTIDSSLLYPGAQTQLDIGGEEGRVLQLHTNDSLDKVTDWYIAKLKPAQIVRKPSSGSTVLHSDRANVVISASDGGGTSILIEQGGDQ
ncbi:MAG: hypothetical protein AUG51_23250 [Acidobacteria bacterium 13_1_20CM_3_53_8]|nr:MAG: hypothetical protein AUG51_23250 [Acidobacteria bacterium 13_1_20CM_3_53_8]